VRLLLALVLTLAVAGGAWAARGHFQSNCDASDAPGYAKHIVALTNARSPALTRLQRQAAATLADGDNLAAAADLSRFATGTAGLAAALQAAPVPDYKTAQRDAAAHAADNVAEAARQAATVLRERQSGAWRGAENRLESATDRYDEAIDTLAYTRKGCPNTPVYT
jgi:hypothetical protein